MTKISVVLNTQNEEKNLLRALSSIKDLADEIVVVDMESQDKTVHIAKIAGAKVYTHKQTGYVEPARNFALRKVQGKHILVLDADEEVPPSLVKKLRGLAEKPLADFYRLPRKNIIFGKWIRHSRWWPDYNIRFFRKGAVTWSEIIHSVPMTRGKGLDLPPKEQLAIIHHNYQTISQFILRMDRYTSIEAESLIKDGYKFSWRDLFEKPLGEFLSRFFAGEGYKDGIHGLALAGLQAFSEFVLYLKIWEQEKFRSEELTPKELGRQFSKAQEELDFWLQKQKIRRSQIFEKFLSFFR